MDFVTPRGNISSKLIFQKLQNELRENGLFGRHVYTTEAMLPRPTGFSQNVGSEVCQIPGAGAIMDLTQCDIYGHIKNQHLFS